MHVRTFDVLSVRYGMEPLHRYEAIRIGHLHGVYVRFERLALGVRTSSSFFGCKMCLYFKDCERIYE